MGVINLDPDQCFPDPHFPIIFFPYFHISYSVIIFFSFSFFSSFFLLFNFSPLFIFHFYHKWVTNHPNVQVYVNQYPFSVNFWIKRVALKYSLLPFFLYILIVKHDMIWAHTSIVWNIQCLELFGREYL